MTQSDNNLFQKTHEVGTKEDQQIDQVSPNKNSTLKTKDTNAVPFDLNDFIRLENLFQASNLTLLQRQILTDILKQLNPISCSQFSHDEKILEQNVEELTHAVEELQQKISDLLPA